MKTRPWPLVVVALAQILTPVVSIIMNALIYHQPVSIVIRAAMMDGPWKAFLFFALMPIGGIAIFLVKSWSYLVFLACLAITTFSNFQSWQQNSTQISMWIMLAIFVMDCALVAYFLVPQVRTVYFNSRLRWWESRPRFTVNADCEIESAEGKIRGTILNLSTGGLFLQPATELPKDAEIRVNFSFFLMQFSLKGKVVHKASHGYGIEWMSPSFKDRMRLRQIESGMLALGIESGRREDPWEDFRNWIDTLIKDRKGLVPNLPSKRK